MTAPALTARVWGVLFRNEWFKARKRLAFWLTLGFFSFVTAMNHGSEFFDARDDPETTYALPEAWSNVFSADTSTFLLIFACIGLILLASSEFTWRTARQNVIDGLSKTQWYWGKIMLLPILGVVYVVAVVLIGGGIAWLGTDLGAAVGPILPLGVLKAAGGLLLAFASVGGLALFLALAIRSSGGAMAVWFLWIFPMEQLIVPGVLGRIMPFLRDYLQYQPFAAAQRLFAYESYDPAAFDRLVTAREAAERTPPPPPELTAILWVNGGWAVLFIGLGFLWFRQRDL